jgi:predicted amidohydrolase
MKLRIAACQFPVSADIERNKRYIVGQLETAARAGAHVAHFSECALGGYAGYDFESFRGYDWRRLRAATEEIIERAREAGLWVVLGSNHRLTGRHRPHNSLYVISPERGIVERYDKLFCMGRPAELDLAHYTAGSRFVVVKIHGVSCGFLICHDWRYPEVYREYERRGVELICQSWYDGNISEEELARGGGVCVNASVLPATVQGHAACNHLWISAANTSKRLSAMGAMLVRPDGLIVGKAPRNRAHVLLGTVDTALELEDLSAPWRRRAASGVLHSGETVSDPRSDDHTCY